MTVPRLRILLLALLAIVCAPLASTGAWAETFPAFTGLVVDQAGVLPADRKAALEQKLEAFQKATGRQLVVATIADLGGDDVTGYGYKLLRAWGVGLKNANNGAILYVAPNEPKGQRGPRIEVGYGLEGVLTDAYSSVIINTRMMPKLRQSGDIAGALDAGSDAIIALLSQPDDQARASEAAAVAAYDNANKHKGSGVPAGLVIWLVIISFIVLSGVLRSRRQGVRWSGGSGGGNWPILLWALDSALNSRNAGNNWGGGSFGGDSGSSSDNGGGGWMGGGFTGGGGGSGGGGGASGSW